jgi:hypothetical protein
MDLIFFQFSSKQKQSISLVSSSTVMAANSLSFLVIILMAMIFA